MNIERQLHLKINHGPTDSTTNDDNEREGRLYDKKLPNFRLVIDRNGNQRPNKVRLDASSHTNIR